MEVTAMNHQGKKISVPVANLNISCLPMVMLFFTKLLYNIGIQICCKFLNQFFSHLFLLR